MGIGSGQAREISTHNARAHEIVGEWVADCRQGGLCVSVVQGAGGIQADKRRAAGQASGEDCPKSGVVIHELMCIC